MIVKALSVHVHARRRAAVMRIERMVAYDTINWMRIENACMKVVVMKLIDAID
jgi:hypothetical protein